jgi:hypothetical protein
MRIEKLTLREFFLIAIVAASLIASIWMVRASPPEIGQKSAPRERRTTASLPAANQIQIDLDKSMAVAL